MTTDSNDRPGVTPAGANAVAGCDILIVDDNEPLRTVMADYLQHKGYAVRMAGNGREALDLLVSCPIRLLITDIFMPDVDGFELIINLRHVRPEPAILAISGDGLADSGFFLEAARHFGVKQTLNKPFSLQELGGVVWQLIGGPAGAKTIQPQGS